MDKAPSVQCKEIHFFTFLEHLSGGTYEQSSLQ